MIAVSQPPADPRPGTSSDGAARGVFLVVAAVAAGAVVLAILGATQQHAQLRDSPKHMSWLAAFLYQAPSWLVLAPMAAGVALAARRWPVEGRRAIPRAAAHALASLAFGALFLAVSVPVRHLFHPAPVVWDLFGAPFYKSGPQWALIGVACYWLVLLGASYADARRRLALTPTTGPAPAGAPPKAPVRITLETRSGRTVLDPAEITWIAADSRGARVHTTSGEVAARHPLARLEADLAPHGVVRVHRANLVNLAHVREVIGSRHRDGSVRLSTGQTVPVSRRRWEALGELAPGADGSDPAPA